MIVIESALMVFNFPSVKFTGNYPKRILGSKSIKIRKLFEIYQYWPNNIQINFYNMRRTMKDKRFNSKLQPYFVEIYQLKKQGYTYKNISIFLLEKYKIKISEASLCSFLKSRERRGIKPTKRNLINLLRKDDGSENKINISQSELEKKTSINNAGKLDEIMKELGIN